MSVLSEGDEPLAASEDISELSINSPVDFIPVIDLSKIHERFHPYLPSVDRTITLENVDRCLPYLETMEEHLEKMQEDVLDIRMGRMHVKDLMQEIQATVERLRTRYEEVEQCSNSIAKIVEGTADEEFEEQNGWVRVSPHGTRRVYLPKRRDLARIVNVGVVMENYFLCKTPCSMCEREIRILFSCSNDGCDCLMCVVCIKAIPGGLRKKCPGCQEMIKRRN